MKTQFGYEPQIYEVSNCDLRIHWEIEKTDAGWEANEAICDIGDTRNVLIEKIISSKYTPNAEIATINNQERKPEEYAAYQEFRLLAKQLADGWIKRLSDASAA